MPLWVLILLPTRKNVYLFWDDRFYSVSVKTIDELK